MPKIYRLHSPNCRYQSALLDMTSNSHLYNMLAVQSDVKARDNEIDSCFKNLFTWYKRYKPD